VHGNHVINDNSRMELVLSLRQAGITSSSVISTMENIPRELFVPQAFKEQAYQDVTLPIGHHQTLSQPAVVGLMTECLNLDDRKKVLEVGTGSGYQTSVLSCLCRRVYTIERHGSLLKEAERRFEYLYVDSIYTQSCDVLWDGTPKHL